MKVTPVVFLALFAVACQAASIQKKDLGEEKPADLYEIDVDTAAEDGSIRGLRIRRSGEAAGSEDYLGYPDINIQKESDGSFSVNGIRVKRSDLKDLADVDLDEEASEDDASSDRTRRSGDLLGFIGGKLHQKLSLLASSSSGHHAESDLHYGAPVSSYNHKSFDIWAFKKAVLNTLLQAAKAIKGGVIALGGQIIKAKGQLISSKGKIIAHKGESISEFGRNVAANALFNKHGSTGHTAPAATGYAAGGVEHEQQHTGFTSGVSSGYGAPIAPTSGYTAISTNFGSTSHGYTKRGAYAVPQEVPKDVHAGLLVLKPINVPDETAKAVAYGKRKASPFAQARDSDSAQSQLEPVVRPAANYNY